MLQVLLKFWPLQRISLSERGEIEPEIPSVAHFTRLASTLTGCKLALSKALGISDMIQLVNQTSYGIKNCNGIQSWMEHTIIGTFTTFNGFNKFNIILWVPQWDYTWLNCHLPQTSQHSKISSGATNTTPSERKAGAAAEGNATPDKRLNEWEQTTSVVCEHHTKTYNSSGMEKVKSHQPGVSGRLKGPRRTFKPGWK